MDITSDEAAVQSRIAEITGVPPVQPSAAQPDGKFAALVQQAMAGRRAAGSMPLPGARRAR